jgi:hypothetical protein
MAGRMTDELTSTFEEDGSHIVIRTVVKGKKLTPEAAWKLHKKGLNPHLGRFGSEADANNFAKKRSESKTHKDSKTSMDETMRSVYDKLNKKR